ncbi:response regulator [Coxiella burnetii]|uniref:response regulator n=1 Tax=Coxiella burnetii TaxID=777 RepID=UPI00051F1B57|nr:response regulator [Coxiella burnetii]AIT63776.1 Response regulator GacA [Coxiella burnetii str. Namibia]
MISVLIVDDEQLVREALKLLLKDASGVKVIGEAETGEMALASAREKRPNVILLDVHLPDFSGLYISQKLLRQYPETKVIILTSEKNKTFSRRLLEVGVHGYLTKEAEQEELIQAIKEVQKGKRIISPKIASQLAVSKMTSQVSGVLDSISDREMEILLMMVRGVPTETIAQKLHLSPKTVSTYRVAIFKKLNVKNDAELILLGMRQGLLQE